MYTQVIMNANASMQVRDIFLVQILYPYPLRGKGQYKSVQSYSDDHSVSPCALLWNISILMGDVSSKTTMSPWAWAWNWCESYAFQSPHFNLTEHPLTKHEIKQCPFKADLNLYWGVLKQIWRLTVAQHLIKTRVSSQVLMRLVNLMKPVLKRFVHIVAFQHTKFKLLKNTNTSLSVCDDPLLLLLPYDFIGL